MRISSWKKYDDAYEIWKEYKRKDISRNAALHAIEGNCGVRSFFIFYPLYKIIKPFVKILQWKPKGQMVLAQAPDPTMRTILLITHEASQSGAPILAFNLLEKFALSYNVISVLLGPGKLEEAFRNVSFATIGPLPAHKRYTPWIHDPILRACRKFSPSFAIVNSIESREALIPLSKAGVPSVLLVHEFVSLCPQLEMKTVAESAGQMVFPARRVWEDAVAAFPCLPLAARPANIITQGPSRIPREWLGGETGDDEEARIAAVMRPLGTHDDAIVVIGCGVIDVRKGVDLFISTAAALKQRSPLLRFRFVWVGAGNVHENFLYSRYLAEQVNRCGLKETVKFLGEVNCLDPVYAMADIFMLSSRLDPFPNVAIDAMFAGLPVVCFRDASGVAELLSDHVDLNRLVVPCADSSSAAEVIEQLSNDDSYLQATKVAIRDLAFSAFDMDRYFESLERLAERASLIVKQEEEDLAVISQSDVFRMEYAAPPGSCKTGVDYIKGFVRESAVFGCMRCPFPGFHPGIYRNAHPELHDPPFVNPLAHYLRNGRPHGPWLLQIIGPEHSPPVQKLDIRVALHLHIHYPELTPELFRPLMTNRTRPDVFVTVSNDEGRREVGQKAAELGISIKEIAVVPNRGRNISPLLTLLGRRLVRDYDIVGHLHAKACQNVENSSTGAIWRKFCLENLLGGKHNMMDVILDRFVRNSKMGIIFPCDPNIIGWTLNRSRANAILERMGIVTELPDDFFFPIGTMFWARTGAIAPLLQLDLDWSDYPLEPLAYDGTILHAIERLLPVVAQYRGFEMAGTYVPGLTR